MLGDGTGNLTPVPALESGLAIYGEQRGAAFADFNQDGRIDLAVSQNAAETKLYLNTTGTIGLRVTLQGPAGNIDGFGAGVQLVYEDKFGPKHYLQAGSGYLSQDAPTIILGGLADNPTAVRVTWSDGSVLDREISVETTEVLLKYQP